MTQLGSSGRRGPDGRLRPHLQRRCIIVCRRARQRPLGRKVRGEIEQATLLRRRVRLRVRLPVPSQRLRRAEPVRPRLPGAAQTQGMAVTDRHFIFSSSAGRNTHSTITSVGRGSAGDGPNLTAPNMAEGDGLRRWGRSTCSMRAVPRSTRTPTTGCGRSTTPRSPPSEAEGRRRPTSGQRPELGSAFSSLLTYASSESERGMDRANDQRAVPLAATRFVEPLRASPTAKRLGRGHDSGCSSDPILHPASRNNERGSSLMNARHVRAVH